MHSSASYPQARVETTSIYISPHDNTQLNPCTSHPATETTSPCTMEDTPESNTSKLMEELQRRTNLCRMYRCVQFSITTVFPTFHFRIKGIHTLRLLTSLDPQSTLSSLVATANVTCSLLQRPKMPSTFTWQVEPLNQMWS